MSKKGVCKSTNFVSNKNNLFKKQIHFRKTSDKIIVTFFKQSFYMSKSVLF